MSHQKLHPIYVALDSHQYNKAVKLCLQQLQQQQQRQQQRQQEQPIMVQALLAHSYLKSGQRSQCVRALYDLLLASSISSSSSSSSLNFLAELQLEHERCQQQQSSNSNGNESAATTTTTTSNASTNNTNANSAVTRKKGKKNKRGGSSSANKKTAAAAAAASATSASSVSSPDGSCYFTNELDSTSTTTASSRIVQKLLVSSSTASSSATAADDHSWLIPPPPPAAAAAAAASVSSLLPHLEDETLLSTICMTLRQLQMPLTAFQIYAFVAMNMSTTTATTSHQQQQQQQFEQEDACSSMLIKAYLNGMYVLVHPKYDNDCDNNNHGLLDRIKLAVFSQQQVLAMTLARRAAVGAGAAATGTATATTATAWASQAALWQVQIHQNNNNNETAPKVNPKVQLLPRLAESLAGKCAGVQQSSSNNNNDGLQRTESFLLLLRALEVQNKYEQQLASIERRLNSNNGNNNDGECSYYHHPPKLTLLDLQSQTLFKLKRYIECTRILEGGGVVESEDGGGLLTAHPDNWSYWKRHVECCSLGSRNDNGDGEGDSDGLEQTLNFVDSILQQQKEGGGGGGGGGAELQVDEENMQRKKNHHYYPLRGPLLVRVQVAAERYRNQQKHRSSINSINNCNSRKLLVDRIIEYGDTMSSRASCAFADLVPYVEIVLSEEGEGGTTKDDEEVIRLLQWLQQQITAKEPNDNDPKIRRSELRAYIFCIQMNYTILSSLCSSSLRDKYTPKWINMLQVWKSFQEYDIITADDQKENRPADELILLAVQQLLILPDKNEGSNTLLAAASILEAGMSYSPHNPHLKILAMRVYGQLNAATRSWELFHRQLFIKHIQYESLSYMILPILLSNGLYQEIITVCKEIIRLQRVATSEAGEFSARAMENFALSKADEFLNFQWHRINRSLTTLEAKGLILDAAPLYTVGLGDVDNQDRSGCSLLGGVHGIVGGAASDIERAKQMVQEIQDPFAAFSLLRLSLGSNKNDSLMIAQTLSDNRDFSVLTSHDLLSGSVQKFDTPEAIVSESKRRGHRHGLLIRGALCVEMTKGPKKGKIVPPSEKLKRRCMGMLASINDATAALEDEQGQRGYYNHLMLALINQCRVIVVVSSGLVSNDSSPAPARDTLEAREESSTSLLKEVCDRITAAEMILSPLIIDCQKSGSASGLISAAVHTVSRLLPEFLVPIFAVFQMCAEVFDLYGWGRRKRKTKRCAAALASVAVTFSSLLDSMIACLNCLPVTVIETSEYRSVLVPDLIDEITYEQTTSYIHHYQEVTKDRISNVILEMKDRLASFDIQE